MKPTLVHAQLKKQVRPWSQWKEVVVALYPNLMYYPSIFFHRPKFHLKYQRTYTLLPLQASCLTQPVLACVQIQSEMRNKYNTRLKCIYTYAVTLAVILLLSMKTNTWPAFAQMPKSGDFIPTH